MAQKIIILGKPNVGKSSLFNRLLKDKIAITSDFAGTTRDINICPLELEHNGRIFYANLCDTAGLMKKANGIFKNVKKMIFDFIDENDLILYVISAECGIDEEDLQIFRSLKNAVLIVNKTDIEKIERWEYGAFGAKNVFFVSSLHNRGLKQLKDFLGFTLGAVSKDSSLRGESQDSPKQSTPNRLTSRSEVSKPRKSNKNGESMIDRRINESDSNLQHCDSSDSMSSDLDSSLVSLAQNDENITDSKTISDSRGSIVDEKSGLRSHEQGNRTDSSLTKRVASLPDLSPQDNRAHINIGIIGRVNVGKSSILNALLNKNRSLVSEVEGTTIDPVADEIAYKGKTLRFVDTAGIRRASKIYAIEKFALLRTKRILEQSDIVLLVLDSSSDFVELDEKISGLSQKYHLGVIILLNKWDIKCADFRAVEATIKRKFAYLAFAPILTISALKMRHIDEIKEAILRVWENYNRRIPTAELNTHIKIATQKHPIPSDKGKIIKIYYATQVDCAPPTIMLSMNRPRALHFSYKRYLVNYFRANFDFGGVPIVILAKGREKGEMAE